MTTRQKTLVIPLILVGVLFFVIGFGVGISGFLTPALQDAFNLTKLQSYFVTTALFSAFVVFGWPSGWLIRKIGYKNSMAVALLIMAIGMLLFVPSSNSGSFILFLVATFVGGIGNTLLQAAVNPYVTIIGPNDSAAMRMSLMGIMNKTAWWLGPVFLGIFIDITNVNLEDVVLPFYMVSGIIALLAIFAYFMPLPEVMAEGEDDKTESDYAKNKTSIFQFPHLVLGIIALFFYVGAETLPMATAVDFAKAAFPDKENIENFSLYVPIGLVLGYIFGIIFIPKLLSQTKALIAFSIIGIISTFTLVFIPSQYVFWALFLASFSNSIMWPAIWPLAIKDLGKFTKQGASLLVMGIAGGGIIPPIYGAITDLANNTTGAPTVEHMQTGYWVLLPCYLFIMYFAVKGSKIRVTN